MEKATSAYISRAVSPVVFISIYIIIIAISGSSFGQDITEKRVQDPAMSIYNLKSLGIDLSDSINAIKRARDLGISEANIRKAILFTQNKSSLSDSNLVEEPILFEETEQEVGAETEITQTEPEQAEVDTSIVITPDLFLGEGRWEGLRYFGYDVFQYGEDAVSPIEIGPVDPGYPIGAGDVIRLILWGEAEFQYEMEVNRDGNILIPGVGQVFVAGNRLDRLRTTLNNYLSKFYSGLSSDPPTIFMDATLAVFVQTISM